MESSKSNHLLNDVLFYRTQNKKRTWQENILFNVIAGHTYYFMHLMVHTSIHIQQGIHANMEVVQMFRHDSNIFLVMITQYFLT